MIENVSEDYKCAFFILLSDLIFTILHILLFIAISLERVSNCQHGRSKSNEIVEISTKLVINITKHNRDIENGWSETNKILENITKLVIIILKYYQIFPFKEH